jgi:hypothetical protein
MRALKNQNRRPIIAGKRALIIVQLSIPIFIDGGGRGIDKDVAVDLETKSRIYQHENVFKNQVAAINHSGPRFPQLPE